MLSSPLRSPPLFRCNQEIEEARAQYTADVKSGKVKANPNVKLTTA
jgi:hypothetical protein